VIRTDDPWRGLSAPLSPDKITARRVDSSLPWGFFWARDIDHQCSLVLRHHPESSPTQRLPRLRGVEMTLSDAEDGGTKMLALRLVDPAHHDIFHRLCLDIVDSAGRSPSEREVVGTMLTRMWRWHHLLRGGADGRLSLDAQRGLVGELIVLESLVLPHLSAARAVASWHGPQGAPKDFEIGRVCIEAKARRGAARPCVTISSEHQLDTCGIDVLFLHVSELDQEQSEVKEAVTLTDVASRCRTSILLRDGGAVEAFEGLLAAAGFRWEDDYRDVRWTEGGHHLFRIATGFPAIAAASCPAGISDVQYSLALASCEPYRVTEEALVSAISGESNAN